MKRVVHLQDEQKASKNDAAARWLRANDPHENTSKKREIRRQHARKMARDRAEDKATRMKRLKKIV